MGIFLRKRYYTKAKWTFKSYETIAVRGPYIFVIPELEIAAVITSSNYRNGKTKEPEIIFEDYILPVILNL